MYTLSAEDDPNHPVPSVASVDVHCVKKPAGSDLYLVVALPLGGTE
jgi:hypothetical protein